MRRLFWRWMGRRWRVRETKWTRAAYSAGAWDADLCREAWEQAVRCAYRAAECERVGKG